MKQTPSPDIRGIFARAVGHHHAGRLDEAVADYHELLHLKPDFAPAHNNLGNALCEQGKPEEAEASYRQALVLQPNMASAHNNLGTMLYERGKAVEAAACYRRALALEPDYPEALNNLGAALHAQGKLEEAERSTRRALVLAPDFAGAANNLGAVLKDQGRLKEAGQVYGERLRIAPRDGDALNGLADVLAAEGDVTAALNAIRESLRIGETPRTSRLFADIVKPVRWTKDDSNIRMMLARGLLQAWARPSELTRTGASLVKQGERTGPCVDRAVRAWPQHLSESELFGGDGPNALEDDALLLALLVSAPNADVELERFLTMARRVLLKAAAEGVAEEQSGALTFYAALARQCFINEYVFFHGEEEIARARAVRDALTEALEAGQRVSCLEVLAVAAYFPLHSLAGAFQLLDMAWSEPIRAVLMQQLREPEEEAQLRTSIPKLTAIENETSRRVQNQYEENPYPRWVRIPLVEKPATVTGYLRRKFPLASFELGSSDDVAQILSAGCGTGQLALELAQGICSQVLAVDLSLNSLGHAARKARDLGLKGIEFAQGDLLEMGKLGRSFDIVECSGVLHHLADPFEGWRTALSLLRPGGYMVAGLYSELGRSHIVAARRFIAQCGYGISSDEIRRCRQDLLDSKEHRGLAASDDFFGISSCRDLLFHVHELRTELPAIAAFIRENRLTLLGFEIGNAALQAYRRRFPDDPAATNLDHWQTFEHDNPDTFAGMYRFWIQKREYGAARLPNA